MNSGLYLTYSSGHKLHIPQTFREFGKVSTHLETPDRIENIFTILSSFENVSVAEIDRAASSIELYAVHTPELIKFLTGVYDTWVSEWSTEIIPDTFPNTRHSHIPEWMPAQIGYYCFDTATPIGLKTVAAARQSATCGMCQEVETQIADN